MAGSAVIGALRVVLGLDSASFDTGAKKAQASLNNLEKAAKGLQTNFTKMFAAVAGVGFAAFIRQGASAASEIKNVSERLGVTTTDFQELAYAAKLAGIDQEQFTSAFEQFNKRMGDFSGNTTEAQKALGRLGISYDQIKTKNPAEQIRLISDGFMRLGPTQEATRISTDLFGKSGAALVGVLIQGKQELANWANEARKAGIILESDVIVRAAEADDEFTRIGQSLKAAGIRIAAEFLPVLRQLRTIVSSPEFQQGVKDLAKSFGDFFKLLLDNKDTVATIGAAFVGMRVGMVAGSAVAGPFGAAIGGVAGALTAGGVAAADFHAPLQDLENELKHLHENMKGAADHELPAYIQQIKDTEAAIRALKGAASGEPLKVNVPKGVPDQGGGGGGLAIAKQIDELKLKTAELRGQLDGLGTGFASLLQGKVPLDTLLKGIQALTQEQKNLLAANATYQIALAAQAAMTPYEKLQEDLKKLEGSYQALIIVQGKAGKESAEEYSKAWKDNIKKQQEIIVQAVADIASNLASGFKAFAEQNKKFAMAAKTAAIASALINTYQAATKALTAAPPPLNYALMAATIVAGLGQVAQIKAQNFAKGGSFKVPGGISGVDNKFVPLNLAAGEMVDITPADQVAGGGGRPQTIELRSRRLTDFLSMEDMRDLVDGLNSAGRDGYRLKGGDLMGGIYTSSAQIALNQSTKDNPVIGWQSLASATNITATSTATGFPASNLVDPATRPSWKSNTVGGVEYLTITPSGGQSIDYLAIAGHNLFSIGCLPGVDTCTNIGAGNWVQQIFPAYVLADNGPIIFRFVAGAYQGIRLSLVGGTAQKIVGSLYVGKLLVFERSVRIDIDHTPAPFGLKSRIISGMSENGNFLGRIVQSQWSEGKIDFNYVTPTFFRTNFAPFYFQSAETPFFLAWWPSKYLTDAGYFWLTEDMIVPDDTITDRFSIGMKYQGITR